MCLLNVIVHHRRHIFLLSDPNWEKKEQIEKNKKIKVKEKNNASIKNILGT